jgi:hypothetical protein
MDSRTCPLCTTPILATAVNFAQLVAFPSHSRFSLKKLSLVVPGGGEQFHVCEGGCVTVGCRRV